MEEQKEGKFVLASKSEHKSMLSLMNVVISEREKKQEAKKRDVKFNKKQQRKIELRRDREAKGMYQPQADGKGPSLIESIFRPAPEVFKG